MPHVEVVVATIETKVSWILRGIGLVRSARVADAMTPGPLGTEGQPGAEAAIQSSLHRIVMVGSVARLEIHLRQAIAELHHRNRCASRRVHINADDAVGPSTQEQVASLAAYIGHG